MDAPPNLITKAIVRKYVREFLLENDPQSLSNVTDSIIIKAFHFAIGYYCCILENIYLPINETELQSLILRETVKYINRTFLSDKT